MRLSNRLEPQELIDSNDSRSKVERKGYHPCICFDGWRKERQVGLLDLQDDKFIECLQRCWSNHFDKASNLEMLLIL